MLLPLPNQSSRQRRDLSNLRVMLSSVPGKGSVPLEGSVPGKDPADGSVPGKCSVPLESSIPSSDRGKGSGEGPFHAEVSGVPLEGSVLGQGKDPSVGALGPSDTGEVPVHIDLAYPILTRFRFRRLLAFLTLIPFDAFESMQSYCGVFLDLPYLQRLLVDCRWVDTKRYLLNIVPPRSLGVKGNMLVEFLTVLSYMDIFAHYHADLVRSQVAKIERFCKEEAIAGNRNRVKVLLTILSMRSEQLRPTVDWHLVGQKAAEIVLDFITQVPEFSDSLQLPRITCGLHDVVNVFPKGFGGSRWICHVKKAGRVPGSVIIAKYLRLKKKVQQSGQGTSRSGLLTAPSVWLRSSIDEALKAGKRTTLHQEHHIKKYACSEAEATKAGKRTTLHLGHHVKYACNEGMDGKNLWSDVSQNLEAGNYPKRPRLAAASQGTNRSGLLTDPSAWLRASIDEDLKAGKRTTLHQEHHVKKYACNEGMDGKALWSDVSQDLDAGNYSKRPQLTGVSQGTSRSDEASKAGKHTTLHQKDHLKYACNEDETLKVGKRTTLHQGHHVKYSSMQECLEKYHGQMLAKTKML